jgi:potassium-transporting ATPase KdpC subunit
MSSDLRASLGALAFFSIVTGVAYPLAVTGIAAGAFPAQSRGSLVAIGSTIRGSLLVGQSFTSPRYLQGRPSATAVPYDPRGSSGSNLGPTNPRLDSLVRERVRALREANPGADGPIPVELVTASGSGLDPHLSPAAARYQVGRIAQARGIAPAAVSALIDRHIEPRTFGMLGEARVNVLRVNLALDSLHPSTTPLRP